MSYSKSAGEHIFDTINYLGLFVLSVLALYPLLYVAFASVSDPVAMARSGPLLLWPKGPLGFGAYRMVFSNQMIAFGYRNTLLYLTIGTTINFLLTAFGAYALSRKGLPGQKSLMLIIIFTMQFSGGMVPTYLLVRSLGIYNSMWAVLLPSAISTMNLIIMRTYFAALPVELEESARLDGANDFTILFRIIIPVSKPVVATIILFYAVNHWNSFFDALIYLRDRTLYPLQLVLREILIQQNTESMMTTVVQDREPIAENIKYATIIIATLPILVIYPFLQKYFAKGTMIGSVKE